MKITEWIGRWTPTYSGYLATGKDEYHETDDDGNDACYLFADAPSCTSEHLLFKKSGANGRDGKAVNTEKNGVNVGHLNRDWWGSCASYRYCTLTAAAGADALILLAMTIVHDKCLERKNWGA